MKEAKRMQVRCPHCGKVQEEEIENKEFSWTEKFENILEAIKWMIDNPFKAVEFRCFEDIHNECENDVYYERYNDKTKKFEELKSCWMKSDPYNLREDEEWTEDSNLAFEITPFNQKKKD